MGKFKSQFNKRPVKDGIFPCDEILPDDGIDPKYDREPRKIINRKALQLEHKVADALNLTFPQLGDDVLQNVYTKSVVPAPDSSQLLITNTFYC